MAARKKTKKTQGKIIDAEFEDVPSVEESAQAIQPNPTSLEANPVPTLGAEVNVGLNDKGKVVFCGEPDDLDRVLSAMRERPMQIAAPAAPAAELPAAKPKKGKAKKPAKPIDPNKFYAVFTDEQGQVVHTTKPKRLWSEARVDVKTWIGKHGQKAKTVVIYQGDTQAANRGSRMERARTAWHITE